MLVIWLLPGPVTSACRLPGSILSRSTAFEELQHLNLIYMNRFLSSSLFSLFREINRNPFTVDNLLTITKISLVRP